ncbi:MAG TPA: four helix bundle protein [Flavobacteriales bacterium]|nr:four helix bundle protein [Flavobacteriales bacterium]
MNDFDANAWLASFWPGEVAEPSVPYSSSGRRPNPVVDETFELASRVMDYTEVLVKQNAVFADQILRSGTSVGSHVREAQGAQSLKAFINKMKVAHQELEETDYRIDLCHIKAHYPMILSWCGEQRRLSHSSTRSSVVLSRGRKPNARTSAGRPERHLCRFVTPPSFRTTCAGTLCAHEHRF